MTASQSINDPIQHTGLFHWLLDFLLAIAVFGLFAFAAVPGVNEAHYFTKARQFWNPNWLPHDLFLTSGFAHWTFYGIFGWPTRFVRLDVTVWLGRMVGWLMLAVGWTLLSKSLRLTRWQSMLAAVCFCVLTSHFNLSGEWVVDGIEAKVPSYAFVLASLACVVWRAWPAVWLLAGAATAFHPLAGGWSLIILAGLRAWSLRPQRPSRKESIGFLAGLVVAGLLGVLPALLMDWSAPAELQNAAHWITVRQRLGHHLYIWDFARWNFIRFGLVIAIWRSCPASPPIREPPTWTVLRSVH